LSQGSNDSSNSKVTDDIRDIRDNIERIKADTHAINRIMTLSSSDLIKKELVAVVGGSTYRAAILHLTAEPVTATTLAENLGIDQRNLSRFLEPLREKGYISMSRAGTQRLYKRVELVDLLGFETIPEIARLISEWESRRNKPPENRSGETPISQ
jgi:DNA-binding transcriptional ArsR family regulator